MVSRSKDLADNRSTHIAIIEDLACKLKTLGEIFSDSMIMVNILMTLLMLQLFYYSMGIHKYETRKLGNLVKRLLMEEIESKVKNRQKMKLSLQ